MFKYNSNLSFILLRVHPVPFTVKCYIHLAVGFLQAVFKGESLWLELLITGAI